MQVLPRDIILAPILNPRMIDRRRAPGALAFGTVLALRESRGLVAMRGDEYLLQYLPLHRLLDDRHLSESAVDTLHTVAGDEYEWNFPRHQHVGDRINELSPELDVDDAGVDIIMDGRDHGLRHSAERADDGKSQLGQDVPHHHGDQNFVLDQQDAIAGGELQRKHGFVLAVGPPSLAVVSERTDLVAARDRQGAVQSFRPPIEHGLAFELAL